MEQHSIMTEGENMSRSMSKTALLCFLIFVFTLFPSANGAGSDSDQSYGSQMVESGMKMFANYIGDSMISLGTGNETVNRSETPSRIFNMITYTVDPYTFPWVKKWWNIMLVFYVFLFTIACIGGAALVLIQKMSPYILQRIAAYGRQCRIFLSSQLAE